MPLHRIPLTRLLGGLLQSPSAASCASGTPHAARWIDCAFNAAGRSGDVGCSFRSLAHVSSAGVTRGVTGKSAWGCVQPSSRQTLSTASVSGQTGLASRLPRLSIPGASGIPLRLGSLWQAYSVAVCAVAGAGTTYLLWRGLHSAAGALVYIHGPELSDQVLLGVAAALVAAAAAYSRSYFTLSTSVAYTSAVRQLTSSAAVREVLGSPVVARSLRCASLSGGGLRIKDLRLKSKKPRLTMAFEVVGPERSGLVALEVRKKHGRHMFTLLAVDVSSLDGSLASVSSSGSPASAPAAPRRGGAQHGAARLFLVGDEQLYARAEPLLAGLRAPLACSAGMQAIYDREDEEEDEIDRLAVPATGDSSSQSTSWAFGRVVPRADLALAALQQRMQALQKRMQALVPRGIMPAALAGQQPQTLTQQPPPPQQPPSS